MRLSLTVQYTLKDRPKGYLGLTGEYVTYGRQGPVPFERMAYMLLRDTLAYYCMFQNAEALNAALDKLRKGISDLCVVDEEVDGG